MYPIHSRLRTKKKKRRCLAAREAIWDKNKDISVCVCVCVCVSCSVVSNSAILRTVACQVPLSTEFSRQEYCRGLSFPSPGDLPHPAIEPISPALRADSLLTEPLGKPKDVRGVCERHSVL